MRTTGIVCAVLAAALVAMPTARAETLAFKADLAPVAGSGSKAAGTLAAEYDTDTRKLTWRGSYQGIGTYATAANFHGPGDKIVVRLKAIDSPFEGTAIVSEKRAPDLIAGRWFLLLRTAAFPDGELRGQLVRAN